MSPFPLVTVPFVMVPPLPNNGWDDFFLQQTTSAAFGLRTAYLSVRFLEKRLDERDFSSELSGLLCLVPLTIHLFAHVPPLLDV